MRLGSKPRSHARARIVLELHQVRLQAEGEEERSKRVALVNPAGGGEAVAVAGAVPEVVLGGSLREEFCAREQFGSVVGELAQAHLSVSGAEGVLRIQSEQHQVRV